MPFVWMYETLDELPQKVLGRTMGWHVLSPRCRHIDFLLSDIPGVWSDSFLWIDIYLFE